MSKSAVKPRSPNTLIEAVSALSCIAELDVSRNVGALCAHTFQCLGKKVHYQTIHWVREEESNEVFGAIYQTYKMVLHYLARFYRSEASLLGEVKTKETLESVLQLAARAAERIDALAKMRKVEAFPDEELQEFQRLAKRTSRRVQPKKGSQALGERIAQAAQGKIERTVDLKEGTPEKKAVIDLDAVRHDLEYELFYLRKENGEPFYKPALLRSMHLVHDLESYFGQRYRKDPLGEMPVRENELAQGSAASIWRVCQPVADRFFRDVGASATEPGFAELKYAWLALSMATRGELESGQVGKKQAGEYFSDFLGWLRKSLQSRLYRRLRKEQEIEEVEERRYMQFVAGLCKALFLEGDYASGLTEPIIRIVNRAQLETRGRQKGLGGLENATWCDRVHDDELAMQRVLKGRPSGPIRRVLSLLEQRRHKAFDPILQGNIPFVWYSIEARDEPIKVVHMPAPIRQKTLRKVSICPEFEAFLLSGEDIRHLLIGLDDRTTLLGHGRAEAVEKLAHNKEYKERLLFGQFPSNTEFFLQKGPFLDLHSAKTFQQHFLEELTGEHGGYVGLEEEEISHLKKLLSTVHRIFFIGKKQLSRQERLDFILLTHLLLVLRWIGKWRPRSLSFTCKDGIDTGGAYTAMLLAFFYSVQRETIRDQEVDMVRLILWLCPLLRRRRTMLTGCFQNAVSLMRRVFAVREELGFMPYIKEMEKLFADLLGLPLHHLQVLDIGERRENSSSEQ